MQPADQLNLDNQTKTTATEPIIHTTPKSRTTKALTAPPLTLTELSKLTRQSISRVSLWPAFICFVIVGVLFSFLNENLTFGPSWLLLLLVVILTVPLGVGWLMRHAKTSRLLGRSLTIVVTLAQISSVVLLVAGLPTHSLEATTLLRDAAILWVSNILIFSLWYWELDGGGPGMRHFHHYHPTDFLFPQILAGEQFSVGWKPGYIDYLYLAFNTSTAFSPTDTSVLATRSKALMMLQSIISLIVIAMLAARAINILPTGG